VLCFMIIKNCFGVT